MRADNSLLRPPAQFDAPGWGIPPHPSYPVDWTMVSADTIVQ
jgi:hypothetical protein